MMLLLVGILSSAFNIQTVKAGTITVPDNFPTIQGAINHALNGDTIFVRSGTYYEDVVMNKSISLIGENMYTTTIFGGNASSVVLVTSNSATVTGFTIRNNEMTWDRYGIRLRSVEGCNISINSLTAENYIGILLSTSSHNKIIRNTFTGNGLAIVAGSFENTIVNNTVNGKPILYLEDVANQIVANTAAGQVILEHCVNVTVQNSGIHNTSIGVQVRNSNSCKIIHNGFGNCYEGVSIGPGWNNQIVGNNITNNVFGLVDYYGSTSFISGNYVADNAQHGIYLMQSGNNSIVGNTLAQNNNTGIYLDYESSDYVSGNNMIYGYCGTCIWFSSGIVFTQNQISGMLYGVEMTYLYDNVISENNMTATNACITLDHTDRNDIYQNNLTTSGIDISLMQFSSNNTIRDNSLGSLHITIGDVGLYFGTLSNNNLVFENSIVANTYGFEFWNCSNNHLYYNNVINNTVQVRNDWNSSTTNTWDNDYPSGGNYWSNYDGTDLFRGTLQSENGSDGIGDTPNIIDAQNVDSYPLMGPFGPSTKSGENVTVFPSGSVGLIFENVTSAGSTTLTQNGTGPTPLSSYKIEGKYYCIQSTATYSENITIRIIYDDTNMTQQEEESLQLARWNETTQQWINITTHVDMQNNVIYGETSHLSIFGVTSVLIHDLSIFGVHAYKVCIGKGYTLRIDVDVMDEGDFAEDFDATLDLICGDVTILSIFGVHTQSQNTMTISFYWNTASNALGTYTITAHVPTVPYEINTADNDYTDGTAKVTIPGDVNGDFLVNIKDVSQLGVYWQQHIPPAPANVDINGDDVINIKDASIIGVNWQKHA